MLPLIVSAYLVVMFLQFWRSEGRLSGNCSVVFGLFGGDSEAHENSRRSTSAKLATFLLQGKYARAGQSARSRSGKVSEEFQTIVVVVKVTSK